MTLHLYSIESGLEYCVIASTCTLLLVICPIQREQTLATR